MIDMKEFDYIEEIDEEMHKDLQDLILEQFEEMVFRLFDEYEMK
jgi:hypothetical protein